MATLQCDYTFPHLWYKIDRLEGWGTWRQPWQSVSLKLTIWHKHQNHFKVMISRWQDGRELITLGSQTVPTVSSEAYAHSEFTETWQFTFAGQNGLQGFMGKSRLSLLEFRCGFEFLLWWELEWVTRLFTWQTNLLSALCHSPTLP